jgi:hypothetical protein
MKNLFLGIGAVFAVSQLGAAVAISFNIDSVFTSSGASVPTSGLGMLVADTTGDGFGAILEGSLASGALVGSSDLIVYRASFETFGTNGVWSELASNLSLSGNWTANDRLAFVWFPTLTISSLTASNSISYGLLSDVSWVTPADGSFNETTYQSITTTNNGFFTPNSATLSIPDSMARALLTVGAIPEPSTFALLAGVVGLGFASSRRRRHA